MSSEDHSSKRCNVGFYARTCRTVWGSAERFPCDLLLRRLHGSLAGGCSLISLFFRQNGIFDYFCRPRRHLGSPYVTFADSAQLSAPCLGLKSSLLLFVLNGFWVTGKLHSNHAVQRLPSATDEPNVVCLHVAQMSLRNNGFPLAAWRMHCFCSDIRGVRQLQSSMGLKMQSMLQH